MRAIGYMRCSTAKQAESGLGIAAQRRAIQAYVKARGWQLLEIVEDSATTGRKPLAERDEGKRLLRIAPTGVYDALVVHRVDRIGRSVGDILNTVEVLQRHVEVHICDGGGDSVDFSSPMGKLFLAMLGAFSELERKLISDRTKEALAERAAAGYSRGKVSWHMTLECPHCGVRTVKHPKRQVCVCGKALLVVPDRYSRATAGMIAEWRSAYEWAMPYRQIAELLSKGPHRRAKPSLVGRKVTGGDRKWSGSRVRKIWIDLQEDEELYADCAAALFTASQEGEIPELWDE